MDKKPAYHSYLLRIWQVKENGKDRWRASLQFVGSSQRRSFESLEALLEFLKEITAQQTDLEVATD